VRRLCGHRCGGPIGFADQSNARVNAPISPPPARKSALVDLLISSIEDDRYAKSTSKSYGCGALN
jgi:hypothetical protein